MSVTVGPSRPSRLAGWGRLLRLPNLLTVPGDPIIGFLLAGGSAMDGGWRRLVPAAGASVLLYAAGLIQNDLAHRDEDARTRPLRPLPSGAVGSRSAWAALVVLAMAAMLVAGRVGPAATSHLAFGLLALITLYNYGASRVRLVGPLNMGLCRAASVLLGASGAGGWDPLGRWPVVLAAMTVGLYVAAITRLAMRETRTTEVGDMRWWPYRVLVVGYVVLVTSLTAWGQPETELWHVGASGVFLAVGVGWGIYCGHRLQGVCEPARIGQAVGRWVRALLVVQAAMAAVTGAEGVIFAVCLFSAWPAAGLLARRFASS